MKRMLKEWCRAFVIGFLLPVCMIGFAVSVGHSPAEGLQTDPPEPTVLPAPSAAPTQAATVPSEPSASEPASPTQWVDVKLDEATVQMELETYIIGVVLGEMPASFETEALKAQAIVARTYTLKMALDEKKHGGAVCTDPSCCQAYCAQEEYLQSGGTQAALEKVASAVEATRGTVLLYDGALITATYFSCSGGSTEDAVAVWGYDIPYLRSVESPGEEDAAAYSRTLTLTAQELMQRLGVRLSGRPEDWFGKVTYTDGGGVATMTIGGVSYRGTTLRRLLRLRSTKFTVSVSDGKIVFTTLGYGHRVGMSQYGADAMALRGATCEEILHYYYTDVEIAQYPLPLEP